MKVTSDGLEAMPEQNIQFAAAALTERRKVYSKSRKWGMGGRN